MSNKKLLRYAEAALKLGVTTGTLYSMVSRKEIPHSRIGKRLVVFDAEVLEAWLKRKNVADRREGGAS